MCRHCIHSNMNFPAPVGARTSAGRRRKQPRAQENVFRDPGGGVAQCRYRSGCCRCPQHLDDVSRFSTCVRTKRLGWARLAEPDRVGYRLPFCFLYITDVLHVAHLQNELPILVAVEKSYQLSEIIGRKDIFAEEKLCGLRASTVETRSEER